MYQTYMQTKLVPTKSVSTPYWDYLPAFFPSSLFPRVYKEVKDFYVSDSISVGDPAKRRSRCFTFLKEEKGGLEEGEIPCFEACWTPPILVDIKQQIEKQIQETFDYVLVHIYRDGNAMIA